MTIAIFPVVVAHFCLAPFWYAHVYASSAWLPSTSILLTGLLVPAYLAFLVVRVIRRRFIATVSFGFNIGLVVLTLNFLLDYVAWGISSRHIWTPDEGTIEIEQMMALVGCAIFLLPATVVLVMRARSPEGS